ncbi:glutamate--tRNA ligase [Parvibaculum sp.]|uniref:glutamate--tRNA ligase n=3 Tax=Parvibaculum sp. TaxID=2024848 RepID=UPI001B08FA36|nr:glutamate--tRNA ligase [Parvibaculum sp.]MBO6635550.1 glutamate--tRNA ligase [Parvibaculum sp.]MBO6680354.1 glutamate--tRNA ligase [Parvibaculum sp.]MBO6906150.1 glutamate--tRNA ligase [Parvibaculum sp.]
MTEPKTVVTRFAPSPTGYLHIGGARTALFNWLFARHNGGRFLLRIEDTDRARSTEPAIEAIFEGLRWLGLEWDDEPVFQFSRMARHTEIAEQLLREGKAYRCYASQEELEEMREKARVEGRPIRYDGRWRDRDPSEAPAGIKPVIRFRSPDEGETVVRDRVMGDVRFPNEQLDDLIILRSDGTPTYNLSVVVDDHDMSITHIVRGDDHLTNAGRQSQIYAALGWDTPDFAHVPLIHGPDGAKLSKRHGALGAEAYRDLGYLPEAMRNYLVRLGWAHGDDEIFSTEQAIEWFNLESIGRSPARFDFAKLESLNGHYIREADDARLADDTIALMTRLNGWKTDDAFRNKLVALMPGLKERAKTLVELGQGAAFLLAQRPLSFDDKALQLLNPEARALLARLVSRLEAHNDWALAEIEATIRSFAEEENLKLGKVAQPLRAAVTGSTVSPPIFDVLATLGREEAIGRIKDQAA